MRLKKILIWIKFLPLDLLFWFKGIKIKIVTQPEELRQIYKFRKKIFVQEEYIVAGEVPDLWTDDYDKMAVNIGAFRRGEIIGAARMIKQADKMPLPIEKLFHLKNALPDNCAEISKLIVDRNYRGQKRIIFIGLMKKLFCWSFKNKIEYWAGVMPEKFCQSLKKINVDCDELATYPLSKKVEQERHILRGYFSAQNAKAYLLHLRKL